MTWEETIQYIRTQPEYDELVEKAYFDADLELNVTRFKNSLEFEETLKLIEQHAPNAQTVLDIGCGNGISSINFALKKYQVTAVEPDSSVTVGAGAIRELKNTLNLDNIEVFEDFAENIQFKSNSFDIVYIRQAMHHANNLNKFIEECARVLKPNGLLLTIRDHVILNEKDKNWFFESHPLHKFYGGENAFTSEAYKQAITNTGCQLIKELKHYDNVINYFPTTQEEIKSTQEHNIARKKEKLFKKLGVLSNIPLVWDIYKLVSGFKPLNEKNIPGRMYSYIAIKK